MLFNLVKFNVCCFIILIYCYTFVIHCETICYTFCIVWLIGTVTAGCQLNPHFKNSRVRLTPKKVKLPFSSFKCIYRDLTKCSLHFPRRKRTHGFILLSFLPQWKRWWNRGTQKQQRERGTTQKEDSDDEESTSLLNMVIIWNCFMSKSIM